MNIEEMFFFIYSLFIDTQYILCNMHTQYTSLVLIQQQRVPAYLDASIISFDSLGLLKMTIFAFAHPKKKIIYRWCWNFHIFDTKIKKQRPEKNAANLSEPIIYCEKANAEKRMEKEINSGYTYYDFTI